MLYFHRFFLRHSMLDFDKALVATACLFLASKVEDSPSRASMFLGASSVVRDAENCVEVAAIASGVWTADLIRPFYRAASRYTAETRERTDLFDTESCLFDAIEYDFEPRSPYPLLLRLAARLFRHADVSGTPWGQTTSSLSQSMPVSDLVQDAWRMLDEMMRTTLCVYHRPAALAVAALFLAGAVRDVAIPADVGSPGQPWYSVFCPEFHGDGLGFIREIANVICTRPVTHVARSLRSAEVAARLSQAFAMLPIDEPPAFPSDWAPDPLPPLPQFQPDAFFDKWPISRIKGVPPPRVAPRLQQMVRAREHQLFQAEQDRHNQAMHEWEALYAPKPERQRKPEPEPRREQLLLMSPTRSPLSEGIILSPTSPTSTRGRERRRGRRPRSVRGRRGRRRRGRGGHKRRFGDSPSPRSRPRVVKKKNKRG